MRLPNKESKHYLDVSPIQSAILEALHQMPDGPYDPRKLAGQDKDVHRYEGASIPDLMYMKALRAGIMPMPSTGPYDPSKADLAPDEMKAFNNGVPLQDIIFHRAVKAHITKYPSPNPVMNK